VTVNVLVAVALASDCGRALAVASRGDDEAAADSCNELCEAYMAR
jgi:hypothetical protein